MKSLALVFTVAVLLTFTLAPITFSSDMVILSCEVISENSSSKTPEDQDDFKVSLIYFNVDKDGLITVEKRLGISCVEVLAKLVKDEKFEMQSVSSASHGPAYTLLRK